MAHFRLTEPDIQTDRQHQNRYYAHRAIQILLLGLLPDSEDHLPPPTWLVDWVRLDRGKQGAVKWSVLEQLGRMEQAGFDEHSIRAFATVIEEEKLNAKDAATRLRRARMTMLNGAAMAEATVE
jgi:hypothetical protein